MNSNMVNGMQEKFEDTKRIIRSPKAKRTNNTIVLLINFDLLAFICQYNIKTFIGPIRQKPVKYGYLPYWPNSSQSNNS